MFAASVLTLLSEWRNAIINMRITRKLYSDDCIKSWWVVFCICSIHFSGLRVSSYVMKYRIDRFIKENNRNNEDSQISRVVISSCEWRHYAMYIVKYLHDEFDSFVSENIPWRLAWSNTASSRYFVVAYINWCFNGVGTLCTLWQISTAHLIHSFGKQIDVLHVVIQPAHSASW